MGTLNNILSPSAASSFIGTPGVTGTGGISNGYFSGILSNSFLPQNGMNSGASINDIYNELTSGSLLDDLTKPGTTAGNIKAQASQSASIVSDIFLRGVVIITGFIFLAVGLSMFTNKTLSVVTTPVKKALS